MISPDDPRLSAHADGLLPPEEAARLEKELAADPAARAELERLRALQAALRAAFAAETAAGEPASASEAAPNVSGARVLAFPAWARGLAAVLVIGFIAALILPSLGTVRDTARRSVAASNLRQIGQASLIYASEHGGKLPVASDVQDFARHLARHGINDATIWDVAAELDPDNGDGISTVLSRDGTQLEPAFAKMRPEIAVVLGEVTENDPPTTPIAWTRGLQSDGTWAWHSPYRGRGGYIAFLNGNVSYFKSTRDAFIRYDGSGRTSNILEALPPGSRIGEYEPTAEELDRWSRPYVRVYHDGRTFFRDLMRGDHAREMRTVAFGFGVFLCVVVLLAWALGRVSRWAVVFALIVAGAIIYWALILRIREC